jgi:hypothetical protein
MIRAVTVIVGLWVALAQPVAAQATSVNPAMCGDNSQLATLEGMIPGRHVEPAGWQPKSEDGQQTAWCISPDDPRCAPRDAGAPLYSQRGAVPACGIDCTELVSLRPTELTLVHPPVQMSAARHGVRNSVDRPPRARSVA